MHLFYKENIWSNPHASCIHPDKYNNSVNRIISKEEEREDPRRKLQSSFQLESKSVSSVSTHNSAFLQELQVSTVNSMYRINSTTRNTTTTRLIPYRHPPVTVPHTSKHSTWQNKAPSSPTAFQAHTALAGFQLILPGRNSIPSGSQHPQRPYKIPQVHPFRIPQGELGFFPKGLSIVYLCNTKVSVFQVTYSCA